MNDDTLPDNVLGEWCDRCCEPIANCECDFRGDDEDDYDPEDEDWDDEDWEDIDDD